jgi:hypothetical protein
MEALDRVIGWIEAGKQVGKTIFIQADGEEYVVSAAVQEWQGRYKLYFCKFPVSGNYFDFEGDEYIELESLSSIPALLESRTTIQLHELAPLKGSRIFNPAFTS